MTQSPIWPKNLLWSASLSSNFVAKMCWGPLRHKDLHKSQVIEFRFLDTYISTYKFSKRWQGSGTPGFYSHLCPSVESGKACGSGSPSVLGRNTTAAVNRPISGREVVCPFLTNAINIYVDDGVRTLCASHFSFSCDSLHVLLCWIPPLLSLLHNLVKVIVLVMFHILHFGLSFFFFA